MSKRKLLLADDSITIQKVVNLTFANEDIEVVTVGDGDAAMRKFVEIAPDLVMADVNMPGLDGYRICEMIKQDDETKHIPVILLVGSFEPFDEERAKRVGANDFLTKPFQSIRQLANKVSDLFSGANAGADEADGVDSFADTLETFPKTKETADENINGDAIDDEMIHTDQIGSLPVNESQKFSSAPIYQSALEDTDIDSIQPPYDFSGSLQEAARQSESRIAKTDGDNLPATESFDEKINGFAPEGDTVSEQLNEELEQILKNKREADEVPEDYSVFALDDLDLLELPQSKRGAAKLKQRFDTNKPEIFTRREQTASFAREIDDLSPEFIEAVAAKIVEKFSNEVVAKIVRETVAKMREEK